MDHALNKMNVSFIIPVYNYGRTIEAAVLSIINGNWEHGDEIVVVNDASTDDTKSVVMRLKEQYRFITLVNHVSNQGGAIARNTAVRHAQKDIIFCLDADNLLVAGSIAKLKEALLSSGADAAAFEAGHFFCDHPRNVTHQWVYKPGIQTLADCLAGAMSPPGSGNYMYTRKSWERAGGYPEYAAALDTWGFGFRQLATGSKMVVVPDTYYLHRYGHASYWMRSSSEKDTLLLKIMEPFFSLIEDADVVYIKKNKSTWFSNLSRRSVKVKGMSQGTGGKYIGPSILRRVFRKLVHGVGRG